MSGTKEKLMGILLNGSASFDQRFEAAKELIESAVCVNEINSVLGIFPDSQELTGLATAKKHALSSSSRPKTPFLANQTKYSGD